MAAMQISTASPSRQLDSTLFCAAADRTLSQPLTASLPRRCTSSGRRTEVVDKFCRPARLLEAYGGRRVGEV